MSRLDRNVHPEKGREKLSTLDKNVQGVDKNVPQVDKNVHPTNKVFTKHCSTHKTVLQNIGEPPVDNSLEATPARQVALAHDAVGNLVDRLAEEKAMSRILAKDGGN